MATKPIVNFPAEHTERAILFIRGKKVLLDADIAALYGVPTRHLNQQFRRNRKRFPEDFAFQLTETSLHT